MNAAGVRVCACCMDQSPLVNNTLARALDDDPRTAWVPRRKQNQPLVVRFELPAARTVKSYRLACAAQDPFQRPLGWTLYVRDGPRARKVLDHAHDHAGADEHTLAAPVTATQFWLELHWPLAMGCAPAWCMQINTLALAVS